jgi:hypothetical protein
MQDPPIVKRPRVTQRPISVHLRMASTWVAFAVVIGLLAFHIAPTPP